MIRKELLDGRDFVQTTKPNRQKRRQKSQGTKIRNLAKTLRKKTKANPDF